MPHRFLEPLQIWHRLELSFREGVKAWASRGNGSKADI